MRHQTSRLLYAPLRIRSWSMGQCCRSLTRGLDSLNLRPTLGRGGGYWFESRRANAVVMPLHSTKRARARCVAATLLRRARERRSRRTQCLLPLARTASSTIRASCTSISPNTIGACFYPRRLPPSRRIGSRRRARSATLVKRGAVRPSKPSHSSVARTGDPYGLC